MMTARSISSKSIPTYELYLKGSSHEQLTSADCKMLEIGINHINVIAPLFKVGFSDMVSVDRKTNILTYQDGALEKTVNLGNIDKIKEFVEEFFGIKGDSNYSWQEVRSEPIAKSSPIAKPKRQVNLQDERMKVMQEWMAAENLFSGEDDSNDSWTTRIHHVSGIRSQDVMEERTKRMAVEIAKARKMALEATDALIARMSIRRKKPEKAKAVQAASGKTHFDRGDVEDERPSPEDRIRIPLDTGSLRKAKAVRAAFGKTHFNRGDVEDERPSPEDVLLNLRVQTARMDIERRRSPYAAIQEPLPDDSPSPVRASSHK